MTRPKRTKREQAAFVAGLEAARRIAAREVRENDKIRRECRTPESIRDMEFRVSGSGDVVRMLESRIDREKARTK